MQKTITIRNAYITDKEYIDNLCLSNQIQVFEALNILVENHRKQAQNNEAQTSKLNDYASRIEQLEAENKRLFDDLEICKTQEPVILEKQVEKIVEVEAKLTGSQFICQLDEQTAYNARKLRKFIIADGHVKGENYPNELVNVAVNKFIKRNYADYIE